MATLECNRFNLLYKSIIKELSNFYVSRFNHWFSGCVIITQRSMLVLRSSDVHSQLKNGSDTSDALMIYTEA